MQIPTHEITRANTRSRWKLVVISTHDTAELDTVFLPPDSSDPAARIPYGDAMLAAHALLSRAPNHYAVELWEWFPVNNDDALTADTEPGEAYLWGVLRFR